MQLLGEPRKLTARGVGGLVVGVFAVALYLSAHHGEPKALPAVALGLPVLLDLERATLAAALSLAVLAVVAQLVVKGELPSELTKDGFKFPEAQAAAALIAPDVDASKATLDASQASIKAVAEVLESPQPLPAPSPVADEEPAGPNGVDARDAQPRNVEDAKAEVPSQRRVAARQWLISSQALLDDAQGLTSIADAVRTLPEMERLVYTLAYYQHLSDAEIASLLNITRPRATAMRLKAQTSVRSAALRSWLTRVIDMYAGIDLGEQDPIHQVRKNAQAMLSTGPKRDDPFEISKQIAEALPTDPRAQSLATSWQDELDRLDWRD